MVHAIKPELEWTGELHKCGAFVWTALSSVDLRGAPDAPTLSPVKSPGRRVIFAHGGPGFVATGR